MSELEAEFAKLMLTIYETAKRECNYTVTQFRRMLDSKGAIGTAKYLLNEPKVSSGFVRLWECKRLDLTVEAQLLSHEQFWTLFTEDELHTARLWLRDYDYKV